MKQWLAKDLSKLANVSVRTLHHYDRIGLLKPSLRQSNNYRVYSEKDLLKLQQIIALKFFGFELSQIQEILDSETEIVDNLALQAKLLQKKVDALTEASKILQSISRDCSTQRSIPWEQIIECIEVYHMTQQLQNSWVKEVFDANELKQYAEFEAKLQLPENAEKREAFVTGWESLITTINTHLDTDPKSELGIQLGKQCMDLVNRLYGKKYAHLRTKMFELGFSTGKGLDEVGMTPDVVQWLDQAMDAYWRRRIMDVLATVDIKPSPQVHTLWNELMDDMYGDDEVGKKRCISAVLSDASVSANAKKWLKTTFKL